MKKIAWVIIGGLILWCLPDCGGSRDPEAVLNDLCDIFEEGLGDLEAAKDRNAGVEAFTKIGRGIKSMEDRILAVKKTYPDLKSILKGQVPPELKSLEGRLLEINKRMMAPKLQAKVSRWAVYPKFRTFIAEYQKILTIFD